MVDGELDCGGWRVGLWWLTGWIVVDGELDCNGWRVGL